MIIAFILGTYAVVPLPLEILQPLLFYAVGATIINRYSRKPKEIGKIMSKEIAIGWYSKGPKRIDARIKSSNGLKRKNMFENGE